jgi:hypothetical protein
MPPGAAVAGRGFCRRYPPVLAEASGPSVLVAVLVGIALLACAVVLVLASRCPVGRRVAIGEALLLGK